MRYHLKNARNGSEYCYRRRSPRAYSRVSGRTETKTYIGGHNGWVRSKDLLCHRTPTVRDRLYHFHAGRGVRRITAARGGLSLRTLCPERSHYVNLGTIKIGSRAARAAYELNVYDRVPARGRPLGDRRPTRNVCVDKAGGEVSASQPVDETLRGRCRQGLLSC